MKKELESLIKISDPKEFDIRLKKLIAKYKDQPGFKKDVADFLKSRLAISKKNIDKIEDMINLREQLSEVSEIISLSYIAKKYFGKSRSWIIQRINGNIVNGKKCRFTTEEMQKFQYAINDISKKLGSLSIG